MNCGPFIFSDYDAGEYYKIERNPLFHYAVDPNAPTVDPTNSTTTATTNHTTGQELSWSNVAVYVIGTISGIVIFFCAVIIMRERSNLNNI